MAASTQARATGEKEGEFLHVHVHRMGLTESNDHASAIVKMRKPGTSKKKESEGSLARARPLTSPPRFCAV